MARAKAPSLPPHVDRDELESRAQFGLVQAVLAWPDYCERNNFDTAHGEEHGYLKAYIQRRVNGSMLDYMREADWAPRSARELMNSWDDGSRSDDRIAELANVSIHTVRRARAVVDAAPLAIEDIMVSVQYNVPTSETSPVDESQAADTLAVFRAAVEELPPAHRDVYICRLYHELDVQSTSEELGIPQAKVSTLYNQACTQVAEAVTVALDWTNLAPSPGILLNHLEILG